MKIVSSGDDLTIYLLENNFDNIEIKEYVKRVVLEVKERIKRYISGYYDVYVYLNKKYGIIIELIKESDFDFFKDFVELDIHIKENSKMYFKFKDYFLILNKSNIYYYDNNYYVDVRNLNKKDFLKLTEFGEIIYGNSLKKIQSKLSKIEFML